MAYDPLAESRELLEHGVREDPLRLSRRRRFAALAVDVDDDVAGTLFVVRGPGHVRVETHALVRRNGRWTLLGGGGHGALTDGLADRPGSRELGAPVVVGGGGSVLVDRGRLMPWGARYVRNAILQVSSEVHTVVVGSRVLSVPRHGHLVVVWSSRRPPLAVARGTDGRVVCDVRLVAR